MSLFSNSFSGKTILFVFMAITFNLSDASARIIFQDKFDNYNTKAEVAANYELGRDVTLDTSQGVNGTKCLRITYSGTAPSDPAMAAINRSIANENLSSIYVRFYFKVSVVNVNNGGCKFLKLFGKGTSTNYANSTFILNYNHSYLRDIMYGDGSRIENDTQDTIWYSGYHTDPNAVVQVYTQTFVPVVNRWHCYEGYMKYNTNNNRDGEYKVWIDGALRLHARNIKNRHNDNVPYFQSVRLGDYSHTGTYSSNWNIWYDNLVISDQYIGPVVDNEDVIDNDAPSAPTGLTIEEK